MIFFFFAIYLQFKPSCASYVSFGSFSWGIFSLQAVEGPQDLEAFWISVNTECSGIDFHGLLVADGQATVLLKNNGESTGDVEVGRGGARKSSNHWLLLEANLTHAFSDLLQSSSFLLCIFGVSFCVLWIFCISFYLKYCTVAITLITRLSSGASHFWSFGSGPTCWP